MMIVLALASMAGVSEGDLAGAPSVSPNVFNPTITVFANGLYRYDDRIIESEDGDRLDRHFNVREVEVDFRAAIDPFADGVLIVAYASEVPGEFEATVEEAYAQLKRLPLPIFDEPPLGLKLKAGRFRTETGRSNRLHTHDLPQLTRPLVVEEFLGAEGYVGNGLSAQIFLPTPFDESSVVELTAQVLSGGGVSVAPGPAQSPAAVGNLRWFRALGSAHQLDVSLIFHYGQSGPAQRLYATTYSADGLYRWKPLRRGEQRSFLLGGQVFYAERAFRAELDTDGDGVPDAAQRRDTAPLGYFAFSQIQLSRSSYFGVRWDDTATLTDDEVRRRAASGYLTWYASEFLRFRFGYERRLSDLAPEDGRHSGFAELNLVFGAHPPEPFWVNR